MAIYLPKNIELLCQISPVIPTMNTCIHIHIHTHVYLEWDQLTPVSNFYTDTTFVF